MGGLSDMNPYYFASRTPSRGILTFSLPPLPLLSSAPLSVLCLSRVWPLGFPPSWGVGGVPNVGYTGMMIVIIIQ